MPIFIKNYNFYQTEEYVIIDVPLRNALQKDVDFITTKQYIKANYNPFIFELFLYDSIKVAESKCYIKDEKIIFELCKTNYGTWKNLEASLTKSEQMELKKKYLEELQNETQEAIKNKVNQHGELKRLAVREQIAVDTKFRQKIDDIKKKETEKALKELKLFEELAPATKDRIEAPKKKPAIKRNVYVPKNNTQPAIPQPRQCQSINISFTAREFPTPSRESKSREEQEWLATQAEARRSSGFVDEDLRPEERNPQWLKDKGDEFFKAKNYIGAISAYTTGIHLSKKLASLYVNRSAAHYAIGNLHKTMDDCSTAIDLMTPICEANRILRAKCIARRGAALCKLGMWRQGKDEIQAAVQLIPNDANLKEDLKNVEAKLEPKSEIINVL